MTKTTISLVLCVTLSAALSACNSKTSANEKNFGVTVTQYFDKKGEMCLDPVKWPVDVYEVDIRQQKMYPDNVAGQMAALEAAGLARAEDVDLPETKTKVRRYTMADAAKPFLREKAGRAPRLCWGRKSLDKVVRWADPVKKSGQEESAVIYTYQLSDVAAWARLPKVKEAFPELGRNVDGEHKQKEKLYVKLTEKGWEAYGLND
ncbi:hypothetical protein SRABI118_01192 [Massilia sp. Bi118]|uniref:hypothetical protein n=1 Tax=Massilia sp. Bi118 TaxID=2822346 RepID=UPI001D31C12A|nr:hypothetical protein [Massilia sp. Bi118]CAH0179202.1 hypothetical protein SRABI118_01192 [Massilia sp. Bi118]